MNDLTVDEAGGWCRKVEARGSDVGDSTDAADRNSSNFFFISKRRVLRPIADCINPTRRNHICCDPVRAKFVPNAFASACTPALQTTLCARLVWPVYPSIPDI